MAHVARITLFLWLLLLAAVAMAAEEPRRAILGAQRSAPVTPRVFDGDVRDLPTPREWQPGDPIFMAPQRYFGWRLPVPPRSATPEDPLLAVQLEWLQPRRAASASFTAPSRDFDGLEFSGIPVPDTVGDIGPSHYIQMVNARLDEASSRVRIYDRAEPVPNPVADFTLNTLSTGPCHDGDGADSIVLYDRQADRWLLSTVKSNGSFCMYVSRTSDPVAGGWFSYEFAGPSLPDYLKPAVWATDANGGLGSYILTTNQESEAGVFALDRAAMLGGNPTTFQRMTLPALPGFLIQGPIPADPDGPNAPPAAAPAIIMRHRDTEYHYGPPAPGDLLEMWLFDVDWTDPSNTTLSVAPSIDVAEFDSDLCGPEFACLEQPDALPLIPLEEVTMHRLQYINHNGFETLVGNFTVDVDGMDRGGIRWFELRRSGSDPWALHQEGTYAIDADSRFMGAIAMDVAGNIALGYNVVSASTYPSLLYTGRESTDPPGVLTQPETLLGTGVDSEDSQRYGDYAAMSLDPVDDCTFWFTGEYSGIDVWRTRIASFRFESCPCDVVPQAPFANTGGFDDNQIDVLWDDSLTPEVTEYDVQRSRTPGGPYETIAIIADSSPGMAAGPGYVFEDTGVSGGTTYYYVILSIDGNRCRSESAGEISGTAPGSCLLPPVFAGLQDATSASFPTCRVDLTWNGATPECSGPATYNLYRSTSVGFTPGPQHLLVSGLTGTSATDVSDLTDATSYSYIARAVDQTNGAEDDNVVELSATIGGPGNGVRTVFHEDFEAPDSLDAWTVRTGPGLHTCGEWDRSNLETQRPIAGNGFYALASSQCTPFGFTSSILESPAMDLDFAGIESVALKVDLYYGHGDGDDATMEVWDGTAWNVIWSDPNETVDRYLLFDVTPFAQGNAAFQVRFNYQSAADDLWYAVDDVIVTADVTITCSTNVGAPPAPDGSAGTQALLARRLDAAGDMLQLTWDAASCPAAAYNLLHGNLGDVASHALAGGVCGVGAGSFMWDDAPLGDLFFLVVGTNGIETESSWGQSTAGERNGLAPSGECATTLKNISTSCP